MKQYYSLGMILVILVMLWIGSTFYRSSSTTEGFMDRRITLNMCPRWAPQIQTAKGNTDCCEGTLLDGKCNATSFCTLSPPHDGVETCLEAWNRYFARNASKHCPNTMRNYFEDVRVAQGAKGCSASWTKEDGSAPNNPSDKRCRIYATEKENREKLDSCFVEKERLKVSCPRYDDYTSDVVVLSNKGNFGHFNCSYKNPMGLTGSCIDEKSLMAMWDRDNPNWRFDNNKYQFLNAVGCKTFLAREAERKRLEELRRREEEERRRKAEMLSRFGSFFGRFRRSGGSFWDQLRRSIEEAQRKAREQQERLKRCI